MPRRARNELSPMITLLIAAGAFLALMYLFLVPGSVILRFFIGVAVLAISGQMITTANRLRGSFGMYLLGSRRGIKFVDSISSRHTRFWTLFADWGIAFSFGILSYFFFRKQLGIKPFLLGIATIAFVIIIVYPYLPIILTFINIPQITSKVSTAPAQGVSPLFYVFVVISLIGGFSLFTILLIIYSAAIILYGTVSFIIGFLSSTPNYAILTQQIPGVAPLIPGITLPLFAGIIALVILLIVHEFSHGILARIANVKLKSIGVILFGIIPMGAFVEPDESQVKKLSVTKQDRIFMAGISANMLACLFFFVLTFAMLSYVLPNIGTGGVLVTEVVPGYPANGVIAVNSTITGWNNVTIRNQYDLADVEAAYIPSNKVVVTTSLGAFILVPTSDGKLGINTAPAVLSNYYQLMEFLYAVVALSFGLNFFVAIFNLLPIPGFDGWRIYQNKIKSKKLLRWIAIIVVVAILLNVLPWFWSIS